MKTIVAGSRTISSQELVNRAIADVPWRVTEVVLGGASGVDACGEVWAVATGASIKEFPADWDTHGKAAGPIRNTAMAVYADALIAVWDGESRGTRDMINKAVVAGLEIYVTVR